MAVPVYEDRGAFNAYGGSSTNDVAYPTTVNSNDILVIIILAFGNRTATTPTNWNALASTSDSRSVFTFWKRATGSESGNETVTISSSVNSTSIMMRFSGCITTGTPYESLVNGGGVDDNTQDTGELTTTGIDRLASAIHVISTEYTPTTPTGYTTEFNEIQGAFDTSMTLFTQEQLTAGTVSAEAATTVAGSLRFMQTFALIPIAAAGNDLITGTISTDSTVSALIKADGKLIGNLNTSTSETANLKGFAALIGGINTSSLVSGLIKGKGLLIGAISTLSALSADIKGKAKLIGSIATSSTLSGLLALAANIKQIAGSVNTSSLVSGLIKGKATLISSIQNSSAVSGLIKGFASISGIITTFTTLTGSLVTESSVFETIEENSLITIEIEENSLIVILFEENSILTTTILENSTIINTIEENSTLLTEITENSLI